MLWFVRVLITPIGIALLVMHWLVVVFAYGGDLSEPGFGQGTHLLFYLSIVDVLPLIGANAFMILLSYLFPTQIAAYISFGLLVTFASIQWLLIGSFAQILLRKHFCGGDDGSGYKARYP